MSDRHLLHASDHLDIYHDERGGYLYVDWKGPQTTEQVMAGCEAMLRLLSGCRVSKVLNDNTRVVGSWAGAATWGEVDWFPRMRAAGLRAFAWVQSADERSRSAANRAAFEAGFDRMILLFDDLRSAEGWLRQA